MAITAQHKKSLGRVIHRYKETNEYRDERGKVDKARQYSKMIDLHAASSAGAFHHSNTTPKVVGASTWDTGKHLIEHWKAIPQVDVRNLISRMGGRCQPFITTRGYHIRHWDTINSYFEQLTYSIYTFMIVSRQTPISLVQFCGKFQFFFVPTCLQCFLTFMNLIMSIPFTVMCNMLSCSIIL